MRGIKVAVGLAAAVLLILKLTGGLGGFGAGDRIDATAVTLLVVIAVSPLLDRVTKIGTDGIELQPAAELDAVKRDLGDAVGDAVASATSTRDFAADFTAALADSRTAAQDPMAVVVAARTQLADTLATHVRQRGAGLVGPSIADNARRLADHELISVELRGALTHLGIRLDTARRPSPQYAADIADLVHTAVGSVNQQVQERAGG